MKTSTAQQVATLGEELRAAGTEERAVNEKRYLKSDLEFYGATVPAIRKVVGAYLRTHPDLDREGLLNLVGGLWTQPVHELRMAGVILLAERAPLLEPVDLNFLETLLRDARTWAYVDSLASDAVGSVVERHPESLGVLDRWARDPDFWLRRSAMLALLRPLRRGEGDLDRFLGYANTMLDETEFFIRKAIGWVLREISKQRPETVIEFVEPRIDRISGVTLREAVRRLPDADRDRLLAAYKAR